MSSTRFVITRAGGRSNTQVLCDLIAPLVPGTVVEYATFQAALAVGMIREYTVPNVQGIVRQALAMLSRLHKRTLQNVPRVGYRVALAREHMGLAETRKDKASRQLRMGLTILQHVHFEEMDEQTRRAHQGHLMVTEALVRNTDALMRRMQSVEDAIERLAHQGKAE